MGSLHHVRRSHRTEKKSGQGIDDDMRSRLSQDKTLRNPSQEQQVDNACGYVSSCDPELSRQLNDNIGSTPTTFIINPGSDTETGEEECWSMCDDEEVSIDERWQRIQADEFGPANNVSF